MNKFRYLIFSAILITIHTTFAADIILNQLDPTLIEDSYIVTFNDPVGTDQPVIERNNKLNQSVIPFGEHSTKQTKKEIEKSIGTNGQVNKIYETINAVHLHMNAKEAQRLSKDKRIKNIEPDRLVTIASTQKSPGWALDRLDQTNTIPNLQYNYINTGAGRTIYILDTGLALTNTFVAAEFGNRAAIFFDFNAGGTGNDCIGHGTEVASVAAGKVYGIAKGADLRIVKLTQGCTGTGLESDSITAFNWLAANAPRGTIVNWSNALGAGNCSIPVISAALEASIIAAHSAGIIVIAAAGNDGCDTANYSPTRIAQTFVVGASNSSLLSAGKDAKRSTSRIGWNISTFAPGEGVAAMDQYGANVSISGTSISAPYIAGLFAVACQAAGTYCNTVATGDIFNALRNTGTIGTVTNTNGTPLTGATSRFISQLW